MRKFLIIGASLFTTSTVLSREPVIDHEQLVRIVRAGRRRSISISARGIRRLRCRRNDDGEVGGGHESIITSRSIFIPSTSRSPFHDRHGLFEVRPRAAVARRVAFVGRAAAWSPRCRRWNIGSIASTMPTRSSSPSPACRNWNTNGSSVERAAMPWPPKPSAMPHLFLRAICAIAKPMSPSVLPGFHLFDRRRERVRAVARPGAFASLETASAPALPAAPPHRDVTAASV